MFHIFRSRDLREKEREVDRVGRELFKQIAVFRDKCRSGHFPDGVFKERVNHAYTAGYMIGFVDEKLSKLFDSHTQKSKYAARVFTAIFPRSGVKFIKAKYEARELAEDLSHSKKYQEKVENYVDDFDTGMENGQRELGKWDEEEAYVPHKLTDFLMTGVIPQIQPKNPPDGSYAETI